VPDLTTPWATGPNGRVPLILSRLGYQAPQPFAGLRGYVRPHTNLHRRSVLIECHPLWTAQHPA
jgi:hypothetical protein